MAFKELGGGSGGNVLKWATPGQSVEGRLVGTKRGKVFSGRPSTLAVIKQTNGAEIIVPLTTVLEGRFIENELKPGTVIRITYLGLAAGKNGGNSYKDFKLEIDDASIPAGGAPVSLAQAQAQAQAQAPAAVPASGSEYDILAAKLSDKVGPAAAAPMLNALAQMYPDATERLIQLRQACKWQGVSA